MYPPSHSLLPLPWPWDLCGNCMIYFVSRDCFLLIPPFCNEKKGISWFLFIIIYFLREKYFSNYSLMCSSQKLYLLRCIWCMDWAWVSHVEIFLQGSSAWEYQMLYSWRLLTKKLSLHPSFWFILEWRSVLKVLYSMALLAPWLTIFLAPYLSTYLFS